MSGGGGVYLYPFGTNGLPNGVELVKCVMFGFEDMSEKSEISETKLTMEVLPLPGPADCVGTPITTRVDDSFDIKKMTSVEGITLDDTCIHVVAEVEDVTSDGLTFAVMCRYTGVTDDEAP